MGWPTTNDPRRNFVTLRFTDDEVADLDALAISMNVTRSVVVRDAVDKHVAAAKRTALKNARRAPSNTTALSQPNDAGA